MSTATRPSILPQPDLSPAPPAAHRTRLQKIFPIPAGKNLGVLIAAVLILLMAVSGIEFPVLHHTNGNILFPLDNAYVNITVARNLAFYQVWGVSKYAFQSAASSLLYPIALVPFFFILGAHLIIPLIVNFLAGAYFLLMLQRTLIRYGLNPARQLLILAGAMLLTLLPLLVVSGMEYTLQLLFVFLFIDALLQALNPTSEKTLRQVYLFALLAVAARYEDLLIIALACLLLGRQKGPKAAATLAAIALSPIAAFGVISLIKKSYFLPNSMFVGPYPTYTLVLAFIATTTAVWLITSHRTTLQNAVAGLLLLTIPFTARNAANLAHFQRDCNHIYDQQYLTAGFVHLYYFKQTVGVNEPGAVSYFSEGRKLDYTGIASNDVIKIKEQHGWSPLYADSLSKKDGIRVAIVADPWFSADQLPKWTRIASWDIPDGHREKKITFYAINQYDTTRLRQNLQNYQHLLPSSVSVSYY
jgi:hypothetical protein